MIWAVCLLVSCLIVRQIQETASGIVNTTTFENECTTDGDYVLLSDAQCKPCICRTDNSPVCGTDGKSYTNICFAECRNVEIACTGQCPCNSACSCPDMWPGPLCGSDGRTYDDICQAICADVTIRCDGECSYCEALGGQFWPGGNPA